MAVVLFGAMLTTLCAGEPLDIDCGDSPVPSSHLPRLPSVLLIGDSISMGTADKIVTNNSIPLGYGWTVQKILEPTIATVQHNGGWALGGQAGASSKGVQCIGHWLGNETFDVIHMNVRDLLACSENVLTNSSHAHTSLVYTTWMPTNLLPRNNTSLI